jgi:hypothetical protein
MYSCDCMFDDFSNPDKGKKERKKERKKAHMEKDKFTVSDKKKIAKQVTENSKKISEILQDMKEAYAPLKMIKRLDQNEASF